jgi:predicted RND superfamily exporter protein
MGIYCATGVVIALLLTFVLVPLLYSWGNAGQGRAPPAGDPLRKDIFDRLLNGVHRIVVGHHRAVALVFTALLVISAIGYSRLEVESNFIELFSEDVPIRQAYDFVDARMGGSMSIEVLLDTGETEGITDPEFLRQMDTPDRFVAARPVTTKTVSVLDILKQMRRAFNENRQEYYAIPEGRSEAAQFLLLYEMSGGEDREKFVTFSNDVARLTARTRSLDTKDVTLFFDEVERYFADHIDSSATIEFTGMLSWINAMNDLISQGQRRSFLAAFLVIGLIMTAVLRSVTLGVISMIPNVFPVFISLGFLGLAGTYMDLVMMTFSAIIIGVAVDDTIHFFLRYRREFGQLGNYSAALRVTLSTVGRPITFTTITLTLGFAMLALSDMSGLMHFGLLAGFAFSWALLADFFFAPAIILWLQPLGPERDLAEAGCAS